MLEALDITFVRGERSILDRISLQVPPGTLTVLLGPNGAGKSTLLRVLAGVWRPTSGTIRLGGKPLDAWPRRALARRRAVLSQESALAFNFTVLEVVQMGRDACRGQAPDQELRICHQALEAVGMQRLAHRGIQTLSGGEKQRVHLARTLAQIWQPPADARADTTRCLLLDEPISNLDLRYQHTAMQLAARFRDDGVGVFAILHDPNLALQYADRILLLDRDGHLAELPVDHASAARALTALYGLPLSLLSAAPHPTPFIMPSHSDASPARCPQ